MGQASFYSAQTYDLAIDTSTFSASAGAAAYTAGVTYYARLDYSPSMLNSGYVSVLWAPGTGTAGTAYIGLYYCTTAGELYLIGTSTNIGGASAGVVRKNVYPALSGFENPSGHLYGALLVATDAGTDHVNFGRSTAAVTLASYEAALMADPTTLDAMASYPRAFKGAGTGLTQLPNNEAISGVTTVDLLPWFAID